MNSHNKTDYISWTILIGILLLLVEISFFSKGLIFPILFSSFLLYFGGKKFYSTFRKLLFAIGCLILFFTTINMMVFKFLVLSVAAYVLFYFFKSKKRPFLIEPTIEDNSNFKGGNRVIRRQALLKNIFYGHQKTPDKIYDWEDVNIQTGIGDTRIDFSNTVLPKGEAVISIRNFIGNIQILVPYDIEISIVHSVITGTTIILDQTDEKMLNQTLQFQTENYSVAQQKIKMITSIGIGRLEVKRI